MQTRYKMTMGLEPMDPNELIEIDEHYEAEIALRRQMLADMRDTVLQTSEKVHACILHLPTAASQCRPGYLSASSVPMDGHACCHHCKALIRACAAQSYVADWEMLEMLADYLPRRFPDRFARQGSLLLNHSTGDAWDLSDRSQDAMEISALLVQVRVYAVGAALTMTSCSP